MDLSSPWESGSRGFSTSGESLGPGGVRTLGRPSSEELPAPIGRARYCASASRASAVCRNASRSGVAIPADRVRELAASSIAEYQAAGPRGESATHGRLQRERLIERWRRRPATPKAVPRQRPTRGSRALHRAGWCATPSLAPAPCPRRSTTPFSPTRRRSTRTESPLLTAARLGHRARGRAYAEMWRRGRVRAGARHLQRRRPRRSTFQIHKERARLLRLLQRYAGGFGRDRPRDRSPAGQVRRLPRARLAGRSTPEHFLGGRPADSPAARAGDRAVRPGAERAASGARSRGTHEPLAALRAARAVRALAGGSRGAAEGSAGCACTRRRTRREHFVALDRAVALDPKEKWGWPHARRGAGRARSPRAQDWLRGLSRARRPVLAGGPRVRDRDPARLEVRMQGTPQNPKYIQRPPASAQ